ncbi:MAG: hypothetical protein ACOZIN_00005 [Myxococcota bacterium]
MPIFCGGIVRYIIDKVHGAKESEAEFSPGVLLSSGYIAGGAIAGVVLAMLAIPRGGAFLSALNLPELLGTDNPVGRFLNMVGESEHAHPVVSVLWGLLFFIGLAALLLRVGLRKESAAVSGKG